MEGARQGARQGKHGRDLVPFSSSLLAAVQAQAGACRGGHGCLNSTRPTSPPLDLCTYTSGR